MFVPTKTWPGGRLAIAPTNTWLGGRLAIAHTNTWPVGRDDPAPTTTFHKQAISNRPYYDIIKINGLSVENRKMHMFSMLMEPYCGTSS